MKGSRRRNFGRPTFPGTSSRSKALETHSATTSRAFSIRSSSPSDERAHVVSGFSRTIPGPPEGGHYVRWCVALTEGDDRRDDRAIGRRLQRVFRLVERERLADKRLCVELPRLDQPDEH